ncbi:Uncharacterised protein [Mycobacteroides abscessus subsp. abscessus]|nr:Uncharacterised protein [Mycobacteroides abscessus subsp. abscessus]
MDTQLTLDGFGREPDLMAGHRCPPGHSSINDRPLHQISGIDVVSTDDVTYRGTRNTSNGSEFQPLRCGANVRASDHGPTCLMAVLTAKPAIHSGTAA